MPTSVDWTVRNKILSNLKHHANQSIPEHDDVIKWKHFPRNWPFVRGIHRPLVNSPHKGQWRVALMFSLICVWINDWVNNREADDLRRYHAHYDVTVTKYIMSAKWQNVGPWNQLLIQACLQVDGILFHIPLSTIRSIIMVKVWCGLNRWMQKPLCSQQFRGKHIYHIILFFKTPDTMQAAVIHNEWNQNIEYIFCANLNSENLIQAMSQQCKAKSA